MSSSAISRRAERIKPVHQRRILLVDDNIEALVPLNLILGRLGISVSLVFDGFAARRAMQDRAFDLVVIDWKMPNLNGGECLAFADAAITRNADGYHPLPFVVYSGLSEDQIQLPELRNFYPVGHWRKPIILSQFTQKLAALLERLE